MYYHNITNLQDSLSVGIYESTTLGALIIYSKCEIFFGNIEKSLFHRKKRARNVRLLKIVPIFFILLFIIPTAEAETIKQTMEGGMDIQITHPDVSIVGRTISISIFVENNGWEDKQDITFLLSSPDGSIIPVSENEIIIERLSAGGSFGSTVDFEISPDATEGTHFLNILYSQVLVRNNEEPLNPTQSNIAIPIFIKDKPKVIIHTITPESIFTNAEFPFEVEIISEDSDLNDVNIQIIPPKDIKFRGEMLHTISAIQQNVPITITAQIITPKQEINTEYKTPFQVIVSYTDDIGNEETESKTIQLLLRPRTFMELTSDGGIWIGDFFIAPYVSLGTIIGIPAGAIISLMIRRSQKKRRKKRTRSK